MFKNLSSGSRFAILALLFLAVLAAGFGLYDLATEGSAPGVFLMAGIFLLLAILTYFLSKKTDGRATMLTLLLASSGLLSCSSQRTASNQPPIETVQMVRAADGFDEPAPADTVKVVW